MTTLLERILASKAEARRARPPRSLDAMWTEIEALPPARPLAHALGPRAAARSPKVIAEFKRRSPSAGAIRPGADPGEIARVYAEAGASALSILTDGPFFDGALAHLGQARAAAPLPILRKDFLLEEEELLEARLFGADAVLLIVRILGRERLSRLLAVCARAGLEALVETHDRHELDLAVSAGARVIGINHRDLDTLAIDLSLSASARAQVGKEIVLVAESGLQKRSDLERMRAAEIDAVLIGEALMRAPSPGQALASLLA